ncbi:hypothetical protein N7494_000873 [Penicillium frequentans]|uniref:Amine oxidase domain-containing protein n=1 Tax=Penicillium frequentans TaxID=3151616 RepID=A0AAD6D6N8_9EURO|nr:hypothetical protein N7494_000873 [Penicillium glabrum]
MGPGGFTSIIGAENGPLDLPKVPPLLRAHLGLNVPDAPSILPEIPPHIGIIGAGISGLFLALLIDEINQMVSPKKLFTYSILESSGRNGGRVLTKHFDDKTWNDYYDIGAMRFPDIPIMKRTFRLFKDLGFEKGDGGDLLEYNFEGENCPQRFNDITHVGSSKEDPFNFSISKKGNVPDSTIMEGGDNILKTAFGQYKDALKADFNTGFEKLMKQDKYTTREYLRQEMGYDFFSIQYLETTNSASGLYDQAFTESVIDSFDFDYPLDPKTPEDPKKVDWFCVKGGTSQVIKKLVEKLETKPSTKRRVTSIRCQKVTSDERIFDRPMEVKISNEDTETWKEETENFSAVFSTASLACMRLMDLREAGFSRTQLDAMRNLHYDSSTKVAIEFDNPWWITKCGIIGGSASTDLPIRTCVYPSYNLDAKGKAVLLCSYTWAQDAQRMGSLVDNRPPEGSTDYRTEKTTQKDAQLKELLIQNLALLHQSPTIKYEEMYDIIKGAYLNHDAFDWYANPHTSGAFALFGPGQFENYYPHLIEPAANGHLYLAGEACSAHHAWIVGSLDSSCRALTQYLSTLQPEVSEIAEILVKLETKWGSCARFRTGRRTGKPSSLRLI